MDSPYAVIETGGKQHRVKVGQRFKFEKLPQNEGDDVQFDKVLMLANGEQVKLGAPYVDGGKVSGKILSHGRGKKVHIVKFKRRQKYRRLRGHRQDFTEVEITKIH